MASRRILNYGGGTRCGKMSALSYRALFKHWHSLSVLEIIPNIYVNSSFFDFFLAKYCLCSMVPAMIFDACSTAADT